MHKEAKAKMKEIRPDVDFPKAYFRQAIGADWAHKTAPRPPDALRLNINARLKFALGDGP